MQYLWRAYGTKRFVPPLHDVRRHKRVFLTSVEGRALPPPLFQFAHSPVPLFGKEKAAMECDICKHESSADGSLLCTTCLEAIRRLVAIQREVSGIASTSSHCIHSSAQQTARGADVRDR